MLLSIIKWIGSFFRVFDFSKNGYFVMQIADENKKTELPLSKAVEVALDRALSLVSPLGEFHWRGLNHPDKAGIGNVGKWHSNEQGDATFHTGALLCALAWIPEPNDRVLITIDKIISFFELQQSVTKGSLGREIVLDEFYLKFPKSEQNGDTVVSFFAEGKGGAGHMRWTSFVHNDLKYWLRTDVSVDAISFATMGCYWVWKKFPQFKERVVNILKSQYEYYTKTNWRILDDTGQVVRYGNHSTAINPLSKTNQLIFEKIINGQDVAVSPLFLELANSIPTYVKDLRTNYFNCFIGSSQLLIMDDMGFNVKDGIELLYREVRDDRNYYINAVYKKITGKFALTAKHLSTWILNTGHPKGSLEATFSTPDHIKANYCRWELEPKRSCLIKIGDEITGNHDLLLAYYLS